MLKLSANDAGAVTVSKMPALHPGDVRKFTAVCVQGLEHMKDVIVFPQKVRSYPCEQLYLNAIYRLFDRIRFI